MVLTFFFQLSHIQVYNPKNVQSVELHFRGEKMAKVSQFSLYEYSYRVL